MLHTLVVDDDKDTRDVLRLMLEDAGYVVAEATDGVETLDMLQASQVPLVVLLDLDLPRLDGVGVLHAVARDTRLADQHAFILLTAVSHSRYQQADEVCARLSVPLIVKPFSMDGLLAAVAAASSRLASEPPGQL